MASGRADEVAQDLARLDERPVRTTASARAPALSLVEEVAEVGRGRLGEGDRQQHQLSRERFIEQPQLFTGGEKGHQLGDAKR